MLTIVNRLKADNYCQFGVGSVEIFVNSVCEVTKAEARFKVHKQWGRTRFFAVHFSIESQQSRDFGMTSGAGGNRV